MLTCPKDNYCAGGKIGAIGAPGPDKTPCPGAGGNTGGVTGATNVTFCFVPAGFYFNGTDAVDCAFAPVVSPCCLGGPITLSPPGPTFGTNASTQVAQVVNLTECTQTPEFKTPANFVLDGVTPGIAYTFIPNPNGVPVSFYVVEGPPGTCAPLLVETNLLGFQDRGCAATPACFNSSAPPFTGCDPPGNAPGPVFKFTPSGTTITVVSFLPCLSNLYRVNVCAFP